MTDLTLPTVHLNGTSRKMLADGYFAANWTVGEGGWYSPCGMHESDWELEGYPFPEDSNYADWASAYYHYEALDAAAT